MKVKTGYEVFASSPNNAKSLEHAEEYIRKNHWTSDDVEVVHLERTVVVKAKRDIVVGGDGKKTEDIWEF